MISTGDQQLDVSSYLTPKSPQKDFTWEETDTDYVFKLKPTHSTRKSGCHCSGGQVGEDSFLKNQLLVPDGWGAAQDPGGRIWFYDFSQYPHQAQYEPPDHQEDSVLTWREVLSQSEATALATELAGGRPLSPMPPLILNSFCFPGDSGCVPGNIIF